MEKNIFGILCIIGIGIFSYGVVISPAWFQLLFFGSILSFLEAFCLTLNSEKNEIDKHYRKAKEE